MIPEYTFGETSPATHPSDAGVEIANVCGIFVGRTTTNPGSNPIQHIHNDLFFVKLYFVYPSEERIANSLKMERIL